MHLFAASRGCQKRSLVELESATRVAHLVGYDEPSWKVIWKGLEVRSLLREVSSSAEYDGSGSTLSVGYGKTVRPNTLLVVHACLNVLNKRCDHVTFYLLLGGFALLVPCR